MDLAAEASRMVPKPITQPACYVNALSLRADCPFACFALRETMAIQMLTRPTLQNCYWPTKSSKGYRVSEYSRRRYSKVESICILKRSVTYGINAIQRPKTPFAGNVLA